MCRRPTTRRSWRLDALDALRDHGVRLAGYAIQGHHVTALTLAAGGVMLGKAVA